MPDERKRTAYHEAGHAIVGFWNGLQISSVTVEPKGDRLGWTELAREIPVGEKDWDKRYVFFTLAGRYAEEKEFGQSASSSWMGHHDTLRAMEHLMKGGRSEDEAWGFIGNFWDTAREMVHDEYNWALIDITAKRLLKKRDKTLSANELMNIIERYEKKRV